MLNLKTVILNFKLLPFKQAVKFPLYCKSNLIINCAERGCVVLPDGKLYRGMIKLGCAQGSFGIEPKRHSYLKISKGSKLVFKGGANIADGFSIRIENGSSLVIGNNFFANHNFEVFPNYDVTIGNDCLFGWNVHIRNGNGHTILYSGTPSHKLPDIKIGNHVWIGAYSIIMKGTSVGDNSIVGIKSVVFKPFDEDGVLISGYPADIIRRSVSWEM